MSRVRRVVLIGLTAVAVIAVLFLVVFPWIDRTFVTDPTMGAAAEAAGALG